MSGFKAMMARPETVSMTLVMGGALWGLFWVPMRMIAQSGLSGVWPGMMIYITTAILLLPVVWVRRAEVLRHWRSMVVCGLLTGAAFNLYATSLLMTDVVRAILLFYLTPVWGTLLGLLLLGERLTVPRVSALMLGLVGLVVVLGTEGGFPWPRNLGDVMALLSGMFWAYGSMKLYQAREVGIAEQMIGFIGGSIVVGVILVLLGGETFGGVPRVDMVMSAAFWAVLTALYFVPMLLMTLWPSSLLPPGRAGLLLMSEVLVGVISAALWAGEVFGWREAIGSVMIIGAGFVEVLGPRFTKAGRAEAKLS